MNEKKLNWIEISRRTVLDNLKSLIRLAGPGVDIAVAAKANGYGHGLPEIVSILNNSKAACLALHSIAESELARQAGWQKKIILVGGFAPEEIDGIFRLDLEPVISEIRVIELLGRFCRKSHVSVAIHLKLETGTHRQGITEAEIDKVVGMLKKHPEVSVAGAATHFANIEDTTDHNYAQKQLRQFNKMVTRLKKSGLSIARKHTACSAALLLFKSTYFDLVRPGISLYGYWPSKETYVSYKLSGGKNSILKPALALYSRITQIKYVEPDNFIGYGCTYRTGSRTRIAVLPIGYSDGLDRRLSNLGYVLINGRRAPIRGRICMNLTMIDITNIPRVKLFDTATILGRDGSEAVTADTHAQWCQTINYEILSRLSPLIPRFVI